MGKVNWTIVAVFGIVLLFAFLIGMSVFSGFGGYGGYGRGWGMMGPGMMGSWGFAPLRLDRDAVDVAGPDGLLRLGRARHRLAGQGCWPVGQQPTAGPPD